VLRLLVVVLSLVSLLVTAGCDDRRPEPVEPTASRFNTMKRDAARKATSSFCEISWPAGEKAPRFAAPATKPLPLSLEPQKPAGGWRWINLWATWCHPCIEEIGLLGRWESTLKKDGVALDLELFSVDDDAAALQGWLQKKKMPGTVKWLAGGAADLPAVLTSLGVDKAAGIPVHALVDATGALRCVRTGGVHEEDYGAVKALLTGN
jgi:thiol-disulfide isomerase/thioredoxin